VRGGWRQRGHVRRGRAAEQSELGGSLPRPPPAADPGDHGWAEAAMGTPEVRSDGDSGSSTVPLVMGAHAVQRLGSNPGCSRTQRGPDAGCGTEATAAKEAGGPYA
jgi:hypothetical protein